MTPLSPDDTSTASEGFNEPLDEAMLVEIQAKARALWALSQGTGKPVQLQRVSKHRKGRMPPLTKEQRRRRDKAAAAVKRIRIHIYKEQQADARALLAALNAEVPE